MMDQLKVNRVSVPKKDELKKNRIRPIPPGEDPIDGDKIKPSVGHGDRPSGSNPFEEGEATIVKR